jgi:hypothetical protein
MIFIGTLTILCLISDENNTAIFLTVVLLSKVRYQDILPGMVPHPPLDSNATAEWALWNDSNAMFPEGN